MECGLKFDIAVYILNVFWCIFIYNSLKEYYYGISKENGSGKDVRGTISDLKTNVTDVVSSVNEIYSGMFNLKNVLNDKYTVLNSKATNLLTDMNNSISDTIDDIMPPKLDLKIKTGISPITIDIGVKKWEISPDKELNKIVKPLENSVNNVPKTISKGLKTSLQSLNTDLVNIFNRFLALITPTDIRPFLKDLLGIDELLNLTDKVFKDTNEVKDKPDFKSAVAVYTANNISFITYLYVFVILIYLYIIFIIPVVSVLYTPIYAAMAIVDTSAKSAWNISKATIR